MTARCRRRRAEAGQSVHDSLDPRDQENLCAPARKVGRGSWRTAPVLLIDGRPGFARWSDEVDGDSHTVLSCFHLVGVFRTHLRFAAIACGARIRSNPHWLRSGRTGKSVRGSRCMSHGSRTAHRAGTSPSATRCWHHVSIRAHERQRAAHIAGALGRADSHHNLIRGPRAGGPARRL